MTQADTRLSAREIRGPPPCVGGIVEFHAQPRRGFADAAADPGRILADAGREHEPVDPAQYGGQAAELACRAVHEVVDRQCRRRVTVIQQVAHVIA